ncbi:hypothetical protein A2U01_0080285, partial [Trifolium medium]|nr:hypothetical protein [Trifolium medium]
GSGAKIIKSQQKSTLPNSALHPAQHHLRPAQSPEQRQENRTHNAPGSVPPASGAVTSNMQKMKF